MSSAIFICPIIDSNIALDMEIVLTEFPVEGYGFSVIGQIPQTETCLVRLWSDDAVLSSLASDPNYEFVEDVNGT